MGADWQTLAVIHVLVGYEADFLGMLPFRGEGNVKAEATRGLLISGFIFYTVVALIVALERFAELKGPEKVLKIVNVILLILAGQNMQNCAVARLPGNGHTLAVWYLSIEATVLSASGGIKEYFT